MRAEAQCLLAHLCVDLPKERGRRWVECTGQHDFLPDHYAQRIGELVKLIGLVESPAPHADHVHIGLQGSAQHVFTVRVGDPGLEGINRNEVRTAHEHRDAVDLEVERAGVHCVQFTHTRRSRGTRAGIDLHCVRSGWGRGLFLRSRCSGDWNRVLDQLHGAESHLFGHALHTIVHHLNGVQSRMAVRNDPHGPPQLQIVNAHRRNNNFLRGGRARRVRNPGFLCGPHDTVDLHREVNFCGGDGSVLFGGLARGGGEDGNIRHVHHETQRG
mmetsp:Transcript_38909/g.67320  ORF Transcript_38909/g.67320 Transcript_38909/m.67320 type:complete len:271 (+) Transcript_38909:2207-3019(+)